MTRRTDGSHSDRGAILVFVAIALLVLCGFMVFVFDNGVRLLARGQLQNAADAGALSGAISLAYDEPSGTATPMSVTGVAARTAALQNQTFGGGRMGVAVSFPACPPWSTENAMCIRVNVHRDGTNGSDALPMVFGSVLNITSQSGRATATAQAADANTSNCVKPFLIPDQWRPGDATPNTYNPPADQYVPTTENGPPTTGYGVADIGTRVLLKPGNPATGWAPSDFFLWEDATNLTSNILGCNLTASIGDQISILTGNHRGPVRDTVRQLVANGPVTVAIAMFSPQEYVDIGSPRGNFDIHIVNMMGFTIDGVSDVLGNGDIWGTVAGLPGVIAPGVSNPGSSGAFLKVISLVQ